MRLIVMKLDHLFHELEELKEELAVGMQDQLGDSNKVQEQLTVDVQSIYSTTSAFAALKADGSVVAWGEANEQAKAVSEPLTKLQESGVVTSVTRNHNAIAALKADGSVLAWGDSSMGGDCSKVKDQVTADVQSIYSTTSAFAALKADGSVVAWGQSMKYGTYGDVVNAGDCSAVQDQLVDVQSIYSTTSAFAALKADGSMVAWGNISEGGDCSKVQEQLAVDVQSIYCSDTAFAALKTDGSIIVWGEDHNLCGTLLRCGMRHTDAVN